MIPENSVSFYNDPVLGNYISFGDFNTSASATSYTPHTEAAFGLTVWTAVVSALSFNGTSINVG